MKEIGYGADYTYAHDHPGNFLPQDYLPAAAADQKFYEPGRNSAEDAIRQRLQQWWPQQYPQQD